MKYFVIFTGFALVLTLMVGCGPEPPVKFLGADVAVRQEESPKATVIDLNVTVGVLGAVVPVGSVIDVIDDGERVCVVLRVTSTEFLIDDLASNAEPICIERHAMPVENQPAVTTEEEKEEPTAEPESTVEPEPDEAPPETHEDAPGEPTEELEPEVEPNPVEPAGDSP